MRTFALRSLVALAALGLVYAGATRVLPGWYEARTNLRLSPPPYPASAEATELHQRLLVADMHADSLLWSRDLLERVDRGHADIPRLIEGNVALQAFTLVTKSPRNQNIDRNPSNTDRITDLTIASGWPPRTWFSLFERARFQMARLHETAARSNGQFTILRSRADLDAFVASYTPGEPRVAGWLGLEGAHPLEGEIARLDQLFDEGLRMAGITHFFDNELGGSVHGLDKGGLTDFGRAAVWRMQELGIAVDLAHASSAVIAEVLAMATKPVVVSHGGVKGTCDNNRNLDDEQLRGIAATGGVMAIGFWEIAVCGRDADAIARAIRYTTDLIGVEHVALGSDYDGAVPVPFDASGMARVTEALLAAGFNEEDIAAIAGGNVLRVLRRTLPAGG